MVDAGTFIYYNAYEVAALYKKPRRLYLITVSGAKHLRSAVPPAFNPYLDHSMVIT